MANSLRAQIAISGVSIVILVLIPLVQSKFLAPVTIKRWGKISWSDFRGIYPPFTRYDAQIHSNIYLEYDSTLQRYHAYAGMSDIGSWVKSDDPGQNYLLNHEQYHFDISEFHARMLDKYIAENPDEKVSSYFSKLGVIRVDLDIMQGQYDRETDHGVRIDRQRKWEYKIDSLLTLEDGWITEDSSGAKIYFPHKPTGAQGWTSGIYFRAFHIDRYTMFLSMACYYTDTMTNKTLLDNVRSISMESGQRLKAFSVDTTTVFKAYTTTEDTTHHTSHYLWVYRHSILYQIKTQHSNNVDDTVGYSQITKSFINSFRIITPDSQALYFPVH